MENLDLAATAITDAGIVHLASLTALGRLDLNWMRISSGGLVHLSALTTLRRLIVGFVPTEEVVRAPRIVLPDLHDVRWDIA